MIHQSNSKLLIILLLILQLYFLETYITFYLDFLIKTNLSINISAVRIILGKVNKKTRITQ